MKRFFAVLHARNLEFLRDRSALAWNIILPFFIVLGFAFAFSGGPRDLFKVGVYRGNPSEQSDIAFLKTKYVQFIPVDNLQTAQRKVEHHQLDMLLDVGPPTRYWINTDSPNGYVLEQMLRGSGAETFERNALTGREVRYVDWLAPGIFAMNMMFSCLFGIGYVIVRYRKNGVLKRLKATPLGAFEFLTAQVVSRMSLIALVTTIVYVGCDLLIDFTMHGSYIMLAFTFTLGAVCLISLGLLTAARFASEEFAGGVLNVLTWPMMLLSGVWFSLEGTHPWVQKIAQIFPLTHVVNAARAIMLDGAGFVEVLPQLLVLGVMSAVFLGLAAALFRWE
ncbi:MAG: ABC transporter permease [Gammaproteobacteria bacterium]|nr:ABC transporter permease [Gammaproteobacteria bacterium]